jgi:NAD(P)-dependent dehydrogenase (short-subunit alcohol dehydrogenase family)
MRTVQQLMDLSGRCALVTGAGGHIGFAIAQALAEAGASVALADLPQSRLNENAVALRTISTKKVTAHAIDLAVEADVRALPGVVDAEHGKLDVLVNCAAFTGASNLSGWAEPFEKQETAAWRMAIEVNVTSAFELSQAAMPYLAKGGKGTIINIASIYGMVGPDWAIYESTKMANPAAYGASKAALLQLTRWLSTTVAPDVRVNAISPGGVARGQPEAFSNRYVAKTPLKRMAVEEDFKGAALFLASDMSSYVTGQNLVVDGGWCIW